MKKTKKKLNKKAVVIGSVVLAVVLIAGYALLYYFANIWQPKEKEKFTFEQITQGLSAQVDHVEYEKIKETSEDLSNYDVFLSTTRYFKVKNSGNGELELKVFFYDKDNELLFDMKIYRYGIVLIKTNESKTYYHFCI